MKIEEKINPKLSREVVELLRTRGWTGTRITRTLATSRTLVTRIDAGKGSFSPAQVRILARAERSTPSRLLFDAMEPAALRSKDRTGWIATRRTLEMSESFRASLPKKPAKKRTARTNAA